MAQTVKRLSTMWETWVLSLDREDLLEKEMAIHSSTLAWKIPWSEEPGEHRIAELDTTEVTAHTRTETPLVVTSWGVSSE